MKIFFISWVALIVAYLIVAYWWAARAQKGVEAPVRARRQGVPGETEPDPEIAGRRKVDCMEQEPRKQRVE